MKKTIATLGALILVFAVFSTTVLASNPNYGTSTEHWQLYYEGYV